MKKEKLVIIGSGPAGLTAAIYAARANLQPVVLKGNTPGGQLMGTSFVENWPGERSILGPKLMMNMQEHAKAVGALLIGETVIQVNFDSRPFAIITNKKTQINSDTVIIATGATPKKIGCSGEERYWGKGITTCAVCDGAFYRDKKVVIVGGGDTAMEDASFLKKFTKQIIMVHVLDELTASHAMKKRVITDSDIKIIYNSTVSEFRGNEERVTEAVITNQKTNEQTVLTIDGAFIAIGLHPNTTIFRDKIACDKRGYVVVHDRVKTSIEGIFAAGDVQDYRYRQAITSAGAGCMAALEAERFLSQKSL